MKRLSRFFFSSSTSSIDITFAGDSGSGKEVEDFIQAVRKHAFDKGKQNDNQWTAQFASTCFTGTALRWYEDLPSTKQADWRFLRHALLEQYPAGGKPSNFTIPTPAAAPPSWISSQSSPATQSAPTIPPTAYPLVPSSAAAPPAAPPNIIPPPAPPISTKPPAPQNVAPTGQQALGMRTGRIEVVVPGWPPGSAFVSKSLQNGCFKVVMFNKSMALRVRYFPKTGDIFLNNSDAVHLCLGLTWSKKNPSLAKSSSDSAQLTAVSAKYAPMPIRTSSPWHGDTWGSIWKLADDGQLLVQDQSTGLKRSGGLEVAVYVGDDSFRLYAVSSFDSFTSWVGEGYKLAKLVFTEK
ncbi:hypothetical protein FS837_010145 [Tulasnella sp. UAMH 9824]|nr:hypothetical protein FS837_010145 [Tulasnella sp. UAMH 9824]